jgi:subtilisin family serine protease
MKKNSVFRASLLVLSLGLPGLADDNYILKLKNSSSIGDVCNNHGVHVVKALTGSATGLFVVGVPSGPLSSSIAHSLAADAKVDAVEPDTQVALPELAGEPVRPAGQATLPPLYNPNQNTWYYGTMAWDSYVNQPATWILGLHFAQWSSTGQGAVVALIDTGADLNNLVLKPVLTGGYDFTRNIAGGSEMADVNQSTTEVLDQSTTEVLDYTNAVVLTLNQSTTEVLDQSTTEVLDQSTTEVLDRNPPPGAFGHGTMTAGLVHLVAPQAQLMPLKAFTGDGTANVSAVVQAIYYAVDNGANVINMSFSATQNSQSLQTAVQFANQQGVVAVAAVGNSGQQTTQIYPANYNNVIAVASVNNQDQRSSFSNYGNSLVTVAAPGEGVITTYPGTNNYAAGWGTSFSTPLVAGGVALLFQFNSNASEPAVQAALSNGAVNVGQGLGAGVVNLPLTIMCFWGQFYF